MNFFQTSPDDPQGILSRLMGNPQGGGGEGIFSRLASGFEGAAPWLAYAQASPDQAPEVLTSGLRMNMLRDAKRKEQEEKIKRQQAYQKLFADRPDLAAAAAMDPDLGRSLAADKFKTRDPRYMQSGDDILAIDGSNVSTIHRGKSEFARQMEAAGITDTAEQQRILRQKYLPKTEIESLDPEKQHFTKKPDGTLTPLQLPGTATQGANPYTAGKRTEGEDKAAQYASRMAEAVPELDRYENFAISAQEAGQANVPLIGNYLASKEYQQAQRAERAFINGHLRRDSGATITPDEFERYRKEYIPQPGDGPEVLKDKRSARRRAVMDMMGGAGRNFRPPAGWENPERASQPEPALPRGEAQKPAPRDGSLKGMRQTPNGVPWRIPGAQSSADDGRYRVAEADPVVRPGSDEDFQMRLNQSVNDPVAPYRTWPDVNQMKAKPPAYNDNGLWPPRARV